jgi:hypothetical protein
MSLILLFIFLLQASQGPIGAGRGVGAAVDAYFALPTYVASLRQSTVAASGRSFKQRVRAQFARVFADPLLTTETRWLESVNLETEDVPLLMNRIGEARVLALDTEIVSGDRAFVIATVEVRQMFSEDFGLGSVAGLFRRFPIANMSVQQAESVVEQDPVPESLTFVVTSEKRFAFRMSRKDDQWRIAEVWDRPVTSMLQIDRPH